MKILFYPKFPDATKHYRVDIPAKYLQRVPGVTVVTEYPEKGTIPNAPGFLESHIAGDEETVVVLQRPVTTAILSVIEKIREKRPDIPIICDYDDDYLSVPEWNPGYRHITMFIDPLKEIMKRADGAIASTPPLQEVLQRMMKKGENEVVCIPNGFDFEMFDTLSPHPGEPLIAPNPENIQNVQAMYSLDFEQFNDFAQNRTVVAWAGSRFHFADLDILCQDIENVIKMRDDIIFVFIGYSQGNLIKSSKINRLFLAKGVSSGVSNYYRMLLAMKIDIMLCPLHPCAFNASKSNLKLLEALALRRYPICSDWDPYNIDLDPEFANAEVHGTLVPYYPNKDHGFSCDWTSPILRVADELSDPSYVTKYREENDAYVRSTHDADLRTELYMNYFRTMLELKKR